MATTIKVPEQLRDRVNREAREHNLSAAGFIESLLDGYDRRRRMDAFGKAFRTADAEYWDEFQTWDIAMPDSSHNHPGHDD